MTRKSKEEYFNEIKRRYKESSKEEKGKMLDKFDKVCSHNRKYAIRKLNRKEGEGKGKKGKRGRPKKSTSKAVEEYIVRVWKATNLICSKRLKVAIVEWIESYEEKGTGNKLSDSDKELIREISASTIDRMSNKTRKSYQR